MDRIADTSGAEAALELAQSISRSPVLQDNQRLELIDALRELAERRWRQPWHDNLIGLPQDTDGSHCRRSVTELG